MKRRATKMTREQRAFYVMFRQRSVDEVGQALTTLLAMQRKMVELGLPAEAKQAREFRFSLAELQLVSVANMTNPQANQRVKSRGEKNRK